MFLEVDYYKNKKLNFTFADSKEKLSTNLKNNSIDNFYKNLNIDYNFNSQGFREKEFSTIDWNNSIVLFGCSFVTGEGLPENGMITLHLSKMLNMPVINLGGIGTSVIFSAYNNLRLKDNYKPKAVINLWTTIYRYTYFNETNNHIDCGLWNLEESESEFFKYSLKHEKNLQMHQLYLRNFTKTIWNDTTYVDASMFEETANLFNIDWLKKDDCGRDNIHPGPKTSYSVALYLKDKLQGLI